MQSFSVGDRVKVHGLVAATQHNGKYGVVTSERLSKDGRVVVKLDGGTEINVKPGNLQLILMDLGGKELKVGTKVVTVAFVEPYPPDLSLIGYVKDFSPDRTMVKCMYSLDDRPFFVENIQNLRVAPGKDEAIPLSFAIDIERPDIMTQKKVVIEDSRVKDLSGIESLTSAVSINLSDNEISFLEKVVRLPPRCLELNLTDCQIASLENVVFVSPVLRVLKLQGNEIKRVGLDGVKFPNSLTKLDLSDNKITSVVGVEFPPNLQELSLDGNPMPSIEEGMVLPVNLAKLTLPEKCLVNDDFLSKYKKTWLGDGSNGKFFVYELKTWFPSMQKLISQERGEELPQGWEYTGDPESVVSALTDSFEEGEERDAFLGDMLRDPDPSMSRFVELLAVKPEGVDSSDTTKKASVKQSVPPPPRSPLGTYAAVAASSKSHLAGDYNKYKTLHRGGNKSKTRQRQRLRQSKRNKLQRKNKYSRRRRNAKSRSK